MAMAAGGRNPLQRFDQNGRLISVDGGQTFNDPYSGQPVAQAPAGPVLPDKPMQSFQPNPNLWNDRDMPVTQWSNLGSGASTGFVNGSGQALPAAPTPAPAPAPATSSGGTGDIEAAVNRAWDLQTQLANAAVDKRWNSTQGRQGYLPSDPASQSIHSELLAPVTAQLGAGRAADLSNALQAQLARAAQEKRDAAAAAQQTWENNFRQQQFQSQQAQQQLENDRARQSWELQQQQLKNQLAIENAGLQNQIAAAAKPTPTASPMNPFAPTPTPTPSATGAAGPVNTGSSNGGESFAETMARLGVGAGVSGAAGSGLASYAGTISGGSDAGLKPNGDWHLNPTKPFTPTGPSSGGAGAQPGSPQMNGPASTIGAGIAGVGNAARQPAPTGGAGFNPNPTLGSTLYKPGK